MREPVPCNDEDGGKSKRSAPFAAAGTEDDAEDAAAAASGLVDCME